MRKPEKSDVTRHRIVSGNTCDRHRVQADVRHGPGLKSHHDEDQHLSECRSTSHRQLVAVITQSLQPR